MKKRVLVLGPGKKTRGGISAVISQHIKADYWKEWNCIWIETYIDRNNLLKILYFLKSYCVYLLYLPYCSIVHIHLSEPVSAFRKSLFFWLAYLLQKKTILHFHSFSTETTITSDKKKFYQSLFNKCTSIIVLSTYWKKELSQLIAEPSKIKILHNPVKKPTSFNKKKFSERKPYILFAGTLNKRKGYTDLINAFGQIANQYPQWRLVFAGNGELQKGYEIAKECGVEDQIDFKGWITGFKKDEIFRGASIFCLPSYAEGFPMAVLDALSYSLPIITTPVGGIPDVFNDKKNALLFEPGDIHVLSERLMHLMGDSTLRYKLSKESMLLTINLFSLSRLSIQLNGLYKELLS